jgi:hypothetical protein
MFYPTSIFGLVLLLVLVLVLERNNRRNVGWVGRIPELEIFIFDGVKGQFEYEYEYRFTEYEASFRRLVGYNKAGSQCHLKV